MKTCLLLILLLCNTLEAQTNFVQSSVNQIDYYKSHQKELLDENGNNIFNTIENDSLVMTGQSFNNYFGNSVSSAGDVNGDGYSDVIVGAHYYGFGVGRAYIFYGGAIMDNIADVTLTGETVNSFGYSVSTAGDVNGDGFSDVIVGAPDYYFITSYIRRAYIFYGGSSMDNIADVIIIIDVWDFSSSVSSAGDVNGDSYSDVIVGSPMEGRTYIFYGGTIMDNIADVTMTGVPDRFGNSVSGAGDVNGDNYSDVIVGGRTNNAYIYCGSSTMDSIADITISGEGSFGSFVSSAGDVNDDGYFDVIVGDINYNSNTGRAYIFYGGSSMDTVGDVFLNGETTNDYFGNSVSSAGDVNGDGYSDVIVGSGNYNIQKGRAYIYYGGSSMNNVPDVIFTGEATGNYFGNSVSTAGDVNGDGYSDVIVGANHYNSGVGRAYLYTNLIQKPQLINPINNSGNNPLTINFTWRKSNSVMYYILFVSKDSVFNNIIVNDTISVDTSKIVSGFQKGIKYFWRVRVKDTLGVTKNSSVWNFKTIPPIYLSLKVLMEGMYFPIFNQMTRKDTVLVYLRDASPPYTLRDSAKSLIDSISFTGIFNFNNATTGNYYLVVKHLNTIETWSKTGGEQMILDGSIYNYDFTTSASKAYGNNLKHKSTKYCIYSGDVNRDGIVDVSDFIEVENDAYILLEGRFLPSDLNGDNLVDLADITFVDNNSYNYISIIRP